MLTILRHLLLGIGCLLAVSVASGCSPAGKGHTSSLAIVGGHAPAADTPTLNSTVALVTPTNGKITTLCSGVLVAPNLVLTAAHCVESRKSPLFVLFGADATDPNAKTVSVVKSQTYRKEGSLYFPNFDFAWVKMAENAPAPWKPIEILHSPDAFDALKGLDNQILLAGYGRTASNCDESQCLGRLYEVETKLENFFNEPHFVNLLVVGPNAGHGTCNGDSGGPAFAKVNGTWYLAGILNGKSPLLNSQSLLGQGVCEDGEAIYNFAGAYTDWIETSSSVTLPPSSPANPPLHPQPTWDKLSSLGKTPTLEAMLAFNNYNKDLWVTVDTMMASFRDEDKRFGAKIEDLAVSPSLAADTMRRWTEYKHLGIYFDFTISAQKADQIADVRPIGELDSLTTLSLDSNRIVDTRPLAKLTKLQDLTLRNNYDYRTRRHVPWDLSFLSALTGLKTLDLSGNSGNLDLQSVPWTSLAALESLTLSDNGEDLDLSLIPWARLTKLKTLTIRDSSLTSISPLSAAKSLTTLDLSRNSLTRIDALVGLDQLTTLDLSMNRIHDFSPLQKLPALRTVKALSNLQNAEVCPKGVSCVYSPTSFSDFASYCDFAFTLSPDDLTHWSGGATVMRLIQIAGGPDFGPNGCRNIQNKLAAMDSIDLSGSRTEPPLEDLSPLAPLTQLTSLKLPNNNVRNLSPLSVLSKLRTLDLSENRIENVSPLSALTQLETLWIDGNQVKSLAPLSGLEGLTVYARGNPIESESCPVQSGQCVFDDDGKK